MMELPAVNVMQLIVAHDTLVAERDALAARVKELERAARGGNAINDNADLFEWLANRLVNVHGESPSLSYIEAAKTRAAMLRAALAPKPSA